jgi:hypothetical protein
VYNFLFCSSFGHFFLFSDWATMNRAIFVPCQHVYISVVSNLQRDRANNSFYRHFSSFWSLCCHARRSPPTFALFPLTYYDPLYYNRSMERTLPSQRKWIWKGRDSFFYSCVRAKCFLTFVFYFLQPGPFNLVFFALFNVDLHLKKGFFQKKHFNSSDSVVLFIYFSR